MRIALDLQGAQTASQLRGIGRYTQMLATAIARNAGEHEVLLALSGLFPESIEPLRAVFGELLPQDHIHVWHAPGPVSHLDPGNAWRRQAAERLREAFLASLKPDVTHICSLFEGLGDDAVTSIGVLTATPATSVTLYDLVPLVYRETYLVDPRCEAWYERKLGHLRRARLWLAISEFSRREGIEYLGLPEEWVVNISAAADSRFRPVSLRGGAAAALRQRYGLARPFVMYTGGIDHRKNVEGLIRAYALLPEPVRRAHQLAVVCSVRSEEKAALERLAATQGLAPGEVVLTGFVPDDDLVALYNLCTAFIFPSWHEGFGLPALEAMACGAAVIGADASSLPEVIGRGDALFDPHRDAAIAAKLHDVLTDDAFRADLKRHGPEQARQFSWDKTARLAIEAFERLYAHERETQKVRIAVTPPARPRLAYVSPLPPERTGIADYSAELLPELARHYETDVIVHQAQVTDPWVRANCAIRSAEWFDAHAHRYDRVLYHFGNSHFHEHMFELLERHPGVVVLHDFFLSDIVAHMDVHGLWPHAWTRALYQSPGYPAVQARFQAADTADVVWKYPCNLAVLQQATGVIVHSEFSRRLAVDWYGEAFARDWVVIPHLRTPAQAANRNVARAALGLPESDFVVCSFGLLGPIKLNHRLLAGWLSSSLAKDERCRLLFVGENHGGDYGKRFLDIIRNSGNAHRVHITGFAPTERYRQYLAAADVAVQLRTHSRGETAGTVLDCMNYALPTVINAHASMAEIPQDCVRQLPDHFEDGELAAALEYLRHHPEERRLLGERARAHLRAHHAPRRVADQYAQAIERFYGGAATLRHRLIRSVATLEAPDNSDKAAWLPLAEAIAANLPMRQPQRQLLVDTSMLAENDVKTGIQRLTRGVLQELLTHPPEGYRVEPVYATVQASYRYARRFTLQLLNCPEETLDDEPVEVRAGDCFLGLDLALDLIPIYTDFFARLRRVGGQMYFVTYDLLPVRHPEWFPPGVDEISRRWLQVISQQDGALCISRATADDLAEWLDEVQPERHRPYRIGWFQSGADIDASRPTTGLPDGFETQLARLRHLPSVLMVGTVEPRKGHAQALAAFERLWAQGVEANLVIVGKQGWMVEALVERLRHHPEAGRRLFWFEGVSDEALLKLYDAAVGVLMASQGEGLGLPLVEAARHRRPILARDISVFREVAGEHASYFSGDTPEALAEAVKDWLEALKAGTAPISDGMPWQTWAASTWQIVGLLTDPNHPHWLYRWMPNRHRQVY